MLALLFTVPCASGLDTALSRAYGVTARVNNEELVIMMTNNAVISYIYER